MAREECGSGSVLLAFLLGAVSGAAVALLFAPTTGREAREFLSEKAREGAEKASDFQRQGRDLVKEGRETLAQAIERGRDVYQRERDHA